MYYAQINASNQVVGVSQLSGPVSDPHLIPIATFDLSLLGQYWNGTGFQPTAP